MDTEALVMIKRAFDENASSPSVQGVFQYADLWNGTCAYKLRNKL